MTDHKALTEVARARHKLACDEMDRLTAGNPGTTWRWSIPANPDRDSDLILSASAEDVPRLADAVEALVADAAAENEASIKVQDILTERAMKAEAERDALRAQLDNITKRHASALGAIARVRSVVMTTDGDYLDGADFDGLAGEVQQALGPWVEVSA